jgi:[ribosomal protein S18]-alanine N-acetyltransferase
VSLLLRQAKASDLTALLAIEAQCFTEPNWQARDFSRYDTLVAEIEGSVAGFLVSRQTFAGDGGSPPEREILNVAVASAFRRKGIATLLLRHALAFPAVHFLEVRESNTAAQALYRKMGFIEIGRRPKYYADPEETAIVMQLK